VKEKVGKHSEKTREHQKKENLRRTAERQKLGPRGGRPPEPERLKERTRKKKRQINRGANWGKLPNQKKEMPRGTLGTLHADGKEKRRKDLPGP